VQEPTRPAWQDVVNYFGREILRPDRNIDRNKMAAVVFNHPEKLQALNDIVHPRVYEAWRLRMEDIGKHHPHAIVFADVPLLFEGRMQHLFDLTILVMIEPEEQVNRLMKRSDLCRAEAELRLSCQMPICEKMNLADIVIDNQCAVEETEKKVTEVWQNLLEMEKNQKQ